MPESLSSGDSAKIGSIMLNSSGTSIGFRSIARMPGMMVVLS